MGLQYDDLPKWEFTIKEIQRGIYEVVARRDGGITGSGTGPDPDALVDDLREWARRLEGGLG